MKTYRITAVSYLNTIPFIYGIENKMNADQIELKLEVPSICAQKFGKQETDIALVPVGAFPEMPQFKIITDFCLGANGAVKTVLLLSNTPIQDIKTIYLDLHSKTSINLIKILAYKYLNINPQWIAIDCLSKTQFKTGEALVAIGDKTFELRNKFTSIYDLSELWLHYTGHPFVFACWISKTDTPIHIINQLNDALDYGIRHIDDAINHFGNHILQKDEIKTYLTTSLSYSLDKSKMESIAIFLKALKELE